MAVDPDDSEASSRSSGRRKPSREPPENSISVSRRARRPPARVAVAPEAARSAQAEPVRSSEPQARSSKRSETDPWTVPERVRDRFIQEGNRFYFPDGHEAFKDRGRKLTTSSENTQVVTSLIEIARSRGWSEVSVTGTEAFRRQAWQQARLAGLAVRGYQPADAERVQLVRALARQREAAPEIGDSVSVDARPDPPPPVPRAPARDSGGEPIRGRLLDHGKDSYRHDPNEAPSYFVRLQTPQGPREVWGKDIERAVARSLSKPKTGEEVILQRTGADAVTVRRQVRDEQGALHDAPVQAVRNRWVLETQEFLKQRSTAAEVVRDGSVRPEEAVRRYPELAGTYLNLRAAQIAARVFQDREDQRRFVDRVRQGLARDIERGEPLQPVYLRGPARPRRPPERQREDLTR